MPSTLLRYSSSSISLRLPLTSLVIFIFSLGACEAPQGVDIRGSVDDTAVPAVIRKERVTQLAAWFQKPDVGSRPEAVVNLKEVLASRGTGKVNEFLWHSPLNPEMEAQIYVGAFLESPTLSNRIPDPGEYLSYTGPLSPLQLTNVEIVLLPEAYEKDQPKVASLLKAIEDLLNLPSEFPSFLALIHPFYLDPLQRTSEELPLWLNASYPNLITLYASPLSAPQWGWFSPSFREQYELRDFAFTLKSFDELGKTARVTLAYKMTVGVVREIEEELVLYFSPIGSGLYLRKIVPLSQAVKGVVTPGGEAILAGDPPQLTLSWNPAIVGELKIQEYNAPTRTFTDLIPPQSLNGSSNQVSIGPGVSPATGAIRAPLSARGFYRFLVVPSDNPQLPGIFYAQGKDYPF